MHGMCLYHLLLVTRSDTNNHCIETGNQRLRHPLARGISEQTSKPAHSHGRIPMLQRRHPTQTQSALEHSILHGSDAWDYLV
jgi:hypothetical protein